ncbi:hypothetical protein EOA16_27610 [Mesorhizobium sp. M7A.F.Ca.US.008.03.1.1]|nr:hypothetical protein EOA16_27610 [Mesorhizobium sp. M7A.F.Ca.US.008.03.1.1]
MSLRNRGRKIPPRVGSLSDPPSIECGAARWVPKSRRSCVGLHALGCVEIQVRPCRKRLIPRTGAERT